MGSEKPRDGATSLTKMSTKHGSFSPIVASSIQKLSHFRGPSDPPLVDLTLGELLELQTYQYGSKECLVIPWMDTRWTYNELNHQSSALAQSLLDMKIRSGDRVGIMAGNCAQYAAVFFAVAKIGAILVILNNTYTPTEAKYGLKFSDCKVFFTTRTIGRLDNSLLLEAFDCQEQSGMKIVLMGGNPGKYTSFDELVKYGSRQSQERLQEVMRKVLPHQVVNLQFTSGTTGLPKAAMLTHHNLVNNSRFIGGRMRLTPLDVLCCPPPLFHCFGLVLGLLTMITRGAKVVYPAEIFDSDATLRAISDEGCTAVHGVPAMFDTLFQTEFPPGFNCTKLRTGIIAGAPVPRYLMELLVARFGMSEFTSSYGLTEASPTCFNAFTDDSLSKRLATVGTLMPHAQAKIVDHDGNIVPIGIRGELCISGYQLQAGYWKNSVKTNETMVRDADGILWLLTGDEAVFDEEGYCTITGRFKDIIIRGGENIYPLEIEERLLEHPSISRAVALGMEDLHYGEVVGAFLGLADNTNKPKDREIREWVRERLGTHKAPAHIFWFGYGGIPLELPLTGSGKVRKFEMAKLGNKILAQMAKSSKL